MVAPTLEMVIVEPLPAAVIEPGSAVVLVSEAQVAVATVCVVLTAPLEPVQVVASAPLKLIVTLAVCELAALNSSLNEVPWPAFMRLSLIYVVVRVATLAREDRATNKLGKTNRTSKADIARNFIFLLIDIFMSLK